MKNDVLDYLTANHKDLLDFWLSKPNEVQASVEAHCDIVYSLVFLGLSQDIPESSVARFTEILKDYSIPGWSSGPNSRTLSVHNAAYALGALNLLAAHPALLYDAVFGDRNPDLGQLIDPVTQLPRFPQKWAHHNWRVSHWIGGVPSILLSAGGSGYSKADIFKSALLPVRNAIDRIIAPSTGLLKAYRSTLIQFAFRKFYALRHDPDLGDLGGVCHVTWIDYVIERPYVGGKALLEGARKALRTHQPFMEAIPYCLDFDIVQLVRTASSQMNLPAEREDMNAALMLMKNIEAFFSAKPDKSYSLHKATGALATYHECALLAEQSECGQLAISPVDIIKRANWL